MGCALLIASAPFTYAYDNVNVALSYTGDYFRNFSGGIRLGNEYLDLLELGVEGNYSVSESWTLSTSIQGIHSNGHSITNRLTGDLQILSNLDGGGRFTKVGQASVELSNSVVSVLFGLYDINAEFDVLENANVFINSGHGIGNDIALTGENGPSIYPFYSLGSRLKLAIDDNQSIKLAILDAVPGSETSLNAPKPELNHKDGFFSIVEYESQMLNQKVLIGGWRYSNDVEIGSNQVQNFGFYGRNQHQFSDHRTRSFIRVGYANEKANQHDWFLSGGVTYDDPFNINSEDVFGFAVAYLQRSRAVNLDTDPTEGHETVLELTYLKTVTQHFSVQPNIQYIENPGFRSSHAFVAGLRFQLTL